VIAAVGIAWGSLSIYRAVRNPAPQTMSCADFLAHPPDIEWVRLEGCAVASEHIGIESMRRENEPRNVPVLSASAVYIPLDVAGHRRGDHVSLLLHVDHGPIRRLGSSYANELDAKAAQKVLDQPLEGLVERSIDRSEKDRAELRGLGLNLAEDFVVLDYEARPRPLWLGIGVLGVGLGALAFLVRKWRRRKRPVVLARAKVVAG
jgi:hypothetical protein